MSTQTARDENREQLQELLRDLFQFDAADLDFGVYRIMNQRRDRIEQFIEEDLLDTVDESLESLADVKRAEIETELEEMRSEIREEIDGDSIFNPDGSLTEEYRGLPINSISEYQDVRETLDDIEVAEETESRIFNDLYRFFSRYYEDGDFHTKRRISSKDSKYYVPYNGEETYFHWANNDQYYVKTGEHFTDYRFDASEWTVEFRLEEANVPQDNVKGDSRYFVLGRGDPVSTDADEQTVTIRFQYRQITEDEADDYVKAYNEATGDDRSSFAHMTPGMRCDALKGRIIDYVEDAGAERILTAEKEDSTSTVLKSHLTRYVSENSMDYFVHKDLQKFLEDELEFFLQNEVLDVDELINADDGSSPPVLRARTVREIAERIISFLAQIEDFQKRLFEKKKFVVQTDYMVTLDQVPDDLYDEILENDEQLEQWQDVYNTDEWDTDLKWQGEFNQTFLNNHPYVMIDTALFDDEFKMQLVSAFENLEEATDGVLVNSENFQALNLLMEKYRNEVDCTYIDPPYNTGHDGFLYKDRYQHSSWISMMSDRLTLASSLLNKEGLFFASIDDNEQNSLNHISDNSFSEYSQIAQFVWKSRQNKDNRTTTKASIDHEYVLAYGNKLRGTERDTSRYTNPDDDRRGPWTSENMVGHLPEDERPNLHYELINPETGINYGKPEMGWRYGEDTMEEFIREDKILWPDNPEGRPRRKKFLSELDSDYSGFSSVICDDIYTYHGTEELKRLFDDRVLSFPKPVGLIQTLVEQAQYKRGVVMDFFAGSGTTAEAVMRSDSEPGDKTYILTEVADHFDSVIRPRVQKLAFSLNWSEGIPEDRDGQTHLVKYHRLESYEDALNNIALSESSGPLQDYLEEEVDDYTSGYMLDFESQDSAPLLPEGTFEEPFSHELKIEQNGTSRELTSVDLVETFHYLIGANVKQYWQEAHQDRRYVVTECEVDTESGIETILTAWRRTEDIDYEEEKEWFDEEFDTESYDRVYVNGESQIVRSEPLEITFREKMEESPNVA